MSDFVDINKYLNIRNSVISNTYREMNNKEIELFKNLINIQLRFATEIKDNIQAYYKNQIETNKCTRDQENYQRIRQSQPEKNNMSINIPIYKDQDQGPKIINQIKKDINLSSSEQNTKFNKYKINFSQRMQSQKQSKMTQNQTQKVSHQQEIKQQQKFQQVIKTKQKPKPPIGTYFRFMKDKISLIKKQQPQLSTNDVNKVLGMMWRNLQPDQKRPYQQAYEKDKIKYDKQMKKYYKENPEEKKKKSKKSRK